MSTRDNPCRKFQANIFNKSKCQNCFKPRESHLLNDEDFSQAKPVYGGWLLLAPDGTDFDNPVHRSRKWQRRFFILYEHGLLRYALDEMPTTLPQGTINMNQCLDVVDGESRTGQKSSLLILTPEKEYFIRAENKEIISGWSTVLLVYPRTNKQNQKKKRKVDPPTLQDIFQLPVTFSPEDMNKGFEPGPAKVTVTSSYSLPNIPSAEKMPSTKSTLWQEELRSKEVQSGDGSLPNSPVQSPSSPISSLQETVTRRKEDRSSTNADHVDTGRKARVESGYFSLEKTKDLNQQEQVTSPTSYSTSSNRYIYSQNDRGAQCLSPEYSDSFPPPGSLLSNGSTISSSQSSLDSDNSNSTQASAEGRSTEKPVHVSFARSPRQYATLADIPKAKRLTNREAFQAEQKRMEQRARARSPGREEVARLFGHERRRSQVIEKFEALDIEQAEQMETSCSADVCQTHETRQGRSEKRVFPKNREFAVEGSAVGSLPDVSASSLSSYRRAKSLDRKATESSMTPDLLSFKKGWLTKLYEGGQWKKHWFVLTDQHLRFYRDSLAEEAADLDGEIDLSACNDVTECPVQRNYGFQICTADGSFILSAMTSGIRRNWIQAIMKHVHPSTTPDIAKKKLFLPLSVLKPSSLPDEKSKSRTAIADGDKLVGKPDADGINTETGNADQRRSRARERRKEGRSKTFDWAEFRPVQQAFTQEKDITAKTSKNVSSHLRDTSTLEADCGQLEKERARRREERRKRFGTVDVVDGSTTDDMTRMEIDQVSACLDRVQVKPQDVHVEIEQRWYQVETTPLREEKQIPIASLHPPADANILPSQELPPLLSKQLDQAQKELTSLYEENRLLQENLKVAQEREQSARDGYVLQTEVDAWEELNRLHQDQQTEPNAIQQHQELSGKQLNSLKHSCGKAENQIKQQEVEIQRLKSKLSISLSETVVKEQALAKLASVMKLEKDKSNELFEELQHNEEILHSQLNDSEERLKAAENLLLEKTQAFRDLERQYALQRDYQKEVQRLQEKNSDLTEQLTISEQSLVFKEERFQMEFKLLQENFEREKNTLTKNLKESKDRLKDYEARLQDTEQKIKLLQNLLCSKPENSQLVQQLEEQLEIKEGTIQSLNEHIQEIKEEKNELDFKYQEILNQLTDTDSEVAKLQTRLQSQETDYYNLEHSYEKVSEEFQQVQKMVQVKEEELKQVKEMYGKMIEKKNIDLNEALIKMVALGSSLEETESRLHAKEMLLTKWECAESGLVSGGKEEMSNRLQTAENRITELQQHIQTLQLSYDELQQIHIKQQKEKNQSLESLHKKLFLNSTTKEIKDPFNPVQLPCEDVKERFISSDAGNDCTKRQRIRFSCIQCQKYLHPEDPDKRWTRISSHGSQAVSFSGNNASSESSAHCIPSEMNNSDECISVIHSLEVKLHVAEEKLKEVTLELESQQSQKNHEVLMKLHSKCVKTESQLREQLRDCLTRADNLAQQADSEKIEKLRLLEDNSSYLKDIQGKNNHTLFCLETCRKKLQVLMECKDNKDALFFQTLSDIKTSLDSVIVFLREPCDSYGHQKVNSFTTHNCAEKMEDSVFYELEMQEDKLKLFTEHLAFEASVLSKMAGVLQCADSDVLQRLNEMDKAAEAYLLSTDTSSKIKAYADLLTKKLLFENELCAELDSLRKQLIDNASTLGNKNVNNTYLDSSANTLADSTLLKAELVFAGQKTDCFLPYRLQTLEENLKKMKLTLQKREQTLLEIIKLCKDSELHKVIEVFSENIGTQQESPGRIVSGISQPELVLSINQTEVEKDCIMSLEDVGVQLNEDTCDSSRHYKSPIQVQLARHLKKEADLLQCLSSSLQSDSSEDLKVIQCNLIEVSQALSRYTCVKKHGDISPFLVKEAVNQAQILCAVHHLRLEYERELERDNDAWKGVDITCHEQMGILSAIQEKYEDILKREKLYYTEAIQNLKKQNDDLKVQASQHISELDLKEESLKAVKEQYRLELQGLKATHERDMSKKEDAFKEKMIDSQNRLDAALQHLESKAKKHTEESQCLKDMFHRKSQELQIMLEKEKQQLCSLHVQNLRELLALFDNCEDSSESLFDRFKSSGKDTAVKCNTSCVNCVQVNMTEVSPLLLLRDRIQDLKAQMNAMKCELEHKHIEDESGLKDKDQEDLENLKATCERGFAAMEETHHKVIEDLQRQHQRELEKLREEMDRLLAEETAATISAIEAMKNAHREELERELERSQRSQISSINSDIEALGKQYQEELESIQRELEVLSEQYSQKCLENAHLAQALEAERQALQQCQRENQELNAHNQELNNRLAAEITRFRTLHTGEGREGAGSSLVQGKSAYELEVLLRVKESEIQYLKQEISSLKDELQTSLRDKKYATDKYKDIYTELSIVKAKSECDISRLKEQLKIMTEALGEKSPENTTAAGYDIMKSKSNPDFLKKDRSSIVRQIRSVRSKSVIEQVSWDN
ncbi:myosin phosphatase Rho-interacting protein isoform X2 [Protopterus annectens]|uniref:myosin phosphatase Rho-interacting protein isoform X2 n=1 Tax=Protopterus annectens TaxID=7888 RepID=UPI001CFBA98F|nr:myosin phosphatase Rho-interacting protein isoform X2 [Protopterus annectens]